MHHALSQEPEPQAWTQFSGGMLFLKFMNVSDPSTANTADKTRKLGASDISVWVILRGGYISCGHWPIIKHWFLSSSTAVSLPPNALRFTAKHQVLTNLVDCLPATKAKRLL
jgi:hypothetical protein